MSLISFLFDSLVDENIPASEMTIIGHFISSEIKELEITPEEQVESNVGDSYANWIESFEEK